MSGTAEPFSISDSESVPENLSVSSRNSRCEAFAERALGPTGRSCCGSMQALTIASTTMSGPSNAATLDTYYQEVGRAGRGRDPATIELHYRSEDLGLNVGAVIPFLQFPPMLRRVIYTTNW